MLRFRLHIVAPCGRLTDDNHLRLASRPWLFWVKQARQWRLSGMLTLYTDSSADAGGGGCFMRATGCYLYRVGT